MFDSVIDCLDNDPDGTEIPKIIAQSLFRKSIEKFLSNLIIFAVGVSHLKRKVSKKSYGDLRVVLEQVLSDVCHLDSEGNT